MFLISSFEFKKYIIYKSGLRIFAIGNIYSEIVSVINLFAILQAQG